MEVEAHGQELTAEFLDQLFVSIINDIPDRKWVEITKNHDQVVAGIKHLIDMEFYGEKLGVVFNKEYTHFKKQIEVVPHKSVFEGMYLTDHSASYWTEQDKLAEANNKLRYEREKRRQEMESKPKIRGRKRKAG